MRINIVLLILSITASAVFASENWQKIGDNFYVDVNSIDMLK